MFTALFGIVVMIIPFSLSLLFKDRFKGFLTILAGLVSFHLVLSIATQALQIFSYGVIISISSLVALATLVIIFIRRNDAKIHYQVNYFAIFAIFIIFFQLYSVHHSYTGTITTIKGYQEVVSNSYPYPYYSDEWIGISLVNYSIDNQSLPLVNPLWQNSRFPNPTFPFFSTLSEVFLITGLNPLTTYPTLSILSGLLICLLTYLIVRKMGAGLPAALLSALSIPYIVNGANLPGIWNFLPLTAGLISFLLAMLSLASNLKYLTICYSIISIIFYPPIIVFSLPLILFTAIKNRDQKTIWLALGSLAIIFLIALAVIFSDTNLSALKEIIWSFVFRTNLQNGIPRFNVLIIIPIWILILGCVGLWQQIKTKQYLLISLTAIGLIFWIIYSGTQKVFVIEYQRVIVVISILITILAGLGFEKIKNYLKLSEKHLALLILAIFAIASPFYTQYSDWKKLVMRVNTGGTITEVSPASPANIYLTQDDLNLFKGIKGQRFIAPPWKGLVIGVATQNYPLDSKPSTITNKILTYNSFLSTDCTQKTALAQKFQISYAYSESFTCKSFQKIGESPENFVLYKFVK